MARIKILRGQASELMRSQDMRDFLAGIVSQAADRAKATAPRASGAYAASIASYVEIRGDRAVGIVSALAPYSRKIESQTGNLARALGTVRG